MYLLVQNVHAVPLANGMVVGPLELSNTTGGCDAALVPSIASSSSKYGQPERPGPDFPLLNLLLYLYTLSEFGVIIAQTTHHH